MLDSKYDLRQSVMFSPEGDDLTDEPRIRAEYQRQLGLRNLEAKLARLAKRDDVKQSIEDMIMRSIVVTEETLNQWTLLIIEL